MGRAWAGQGRALSGAVVQQASGGGRPAWALLPHPAVCRQVEGVLGTAGKGGRGVLQEAARQASGRVGASRRSRLRFGSDGKGWRALGPDLKTLDMICLSRRTLPGGAKRAHFHYHSHPTHAPLAPDLAQPPLSTLPSRSWTPSSATGCIGASAAARTAARPSSRAATAPMGRPLTTAVASAAAATMTTGRWARWRGRTATSRWAFLPLGAGAACACTQCSVPPLVEQLSTGHIRTDT